jgi:transcription elongation factor Elf1
MRLVDEELLVYCPRCANETVYIEKIGQLLKDSVPAYLCRCGKCGWRFQVTDPETFGDATSSIRRATDA